MEKRQKLGRKFGRLAIALALLVPLSLQPAVSQQRTEYNVGLGIYDVGDNFTPVFTPMDTLVQTVDLDLDGRADLCGTTQIGAATGLYAVFPNDFGPCLEPITLPGPDGALNTSDDVTLVRAGMSVAKKRGEIVHLSVFFKTAAGNSYNAIEIPVTTTQMISATEFTIHCHRNGVRVTKGENPGKGTVVGYVAFGDAKYVAVP